MKTQWIISLFLIFLPIGNCLGQNQYATSNYKSGDLDDGYYLNPILSGDFADPTIVRKDSDYFMTHSSFDYLPGLTVLHSKDLVNWQPISYALKEYLGSVWAPDITVHEDKFYIYFTVAGGKGGNYVVWADSPYGPWSDPINLGIRHIDPGHPVGEDGSRWLFLSGGHRIRLSDDGLSVGGEWRCYLWNPLLEKVWRG